jgi:flagellar hook-length control protein FliK
MSHSISLAATAASTALPATAPASVTPAATTSPAARPPSNSSRNNGAEAGSRGNAPAPGNGNNAAAANGRGNGTAAANNGATRAARHDLEERCPQPGPAEVAAQLAVTPLFAQLLGDAALLDDASAEPAPVVADDSAALPAADAGNQAALAAMQPNLALLTLPGMLAPPPVPVSVATRGSEAGSDATALPAIDAIAAAPLDATKIPAAPAALATPAPAQQTPAPVAEQAGAALAAAPPPAAQDADRALPPAAAPDSRLLAPAALPPAVAATAPAPVLPPRANGEPASTTSTLSTLSSTAAAARADSTAVLAAAAKDSAALLADHHDGDAAASGMRGVLNSGISAAAAPVASDVVKLSGNAEQWQQPLRAALGERLQLQLQHNDNHAVIRLEPPNLGSIEISIRHSSGALQVTMAASHSEVVRQLNTIGDSMRQDLSQRQFSEVAVTVSASGGRGLADGDGRGRQEREAQQRNPGRALDDGDDGATFAMMTERE